MGKGKFIGIQFASASSINILKPYFWITNKTFSTFYIMINNIITSCMWIQDL